MTASQASLDTARQALAENPDQWYHTIELAPGLVTPGYIDMRRAAPKVLPESLEGKRALDIGTFDGFWAFEMEQRGAEVVTADLERLEDADWPPPAAPRLAARAAADGVELGRGFRLAARARGSAVERVVCNIYDLEPERVGGPVDFAFIGAVLTHLREPVRALQRVRSVLKPGGQLRIFEPISARMTLRAWRHPAGEFKAATWDYTWWLPNATAFRHLLLAAELTDIDRITFARPPCAERTWYVGLSARRPG